MKYIGLCDSKILTIYDYEYIAIVMQLVFQFIKEVYSNSQAVYYLVHE